MNNLSKEECLDFMCRTAQGIALMFGGNCETLVHDMSKPGRPIVAIYNNKVSGRNIGSTMDIYGEQGSIENLALTKDFINNMVFSKNGKYIKSSTINFKTDEFWYALGINFDYTSLEKTVGFLSDIISVDDDLNEEIINESGTQLEEIYAKCLIDFKKPQGKMTKKDRVEFIKSLSQEGVFQFHKSVPFISEKLDVSRYTIYKYLKELEQ